MSLIKKYPLPVYDPPVKYDQFNGGINTSLSNETLQSNELRDGLNCHYKNGALINRPGASLIAHLNFPDSFPETDRFQGDFLYSAANKDWIIAVRNGHIFYGEYLEDGDNSNIQMNLLGTNIVHTSNKFDCENYIVNLPTVYDIDDYYKVTHEGFIYNYENSDQTSYGQFVDDQVSITEENILTFSAFKFVPGVWHDPFFNRANSAYLITDTENSSSGNYSSEDSESDVLYYTFTLNTAVDFNIYGKIEGIDAEQLIMPRGETEYDITLSVDPSEMYVLSYGSDETLIIQNSKRVQGISVDDYFVMATGTRLLRISEKELIEGSGAYYLSSEIMPAYKPSAWEYQNIGVNNLSPFPNYWIGETEGTPTTTIGYIQCGGDANTYELNLDDTAWNFSAKVSTLTGSDKSDYYYKWEFKLKRCTGISNGSPVYADVTDWCTYHYWNSSLNNSEYSGTVSSKGKYNLSTNKTNVLAVMRIRSGNSSLDFTYTEINGVKYYDQLLVRCALTDMFETTYVTSTQKQTKVTDDTDGDFVADQAAAIYSRTHVTKTFNQEVDVDQYFYNIHSCRKITADGMKAILYDNAYDDYNGEWYKTVISEYDYITYNGGLSFRTTKNESIVGVSVFDSNIVVFADNPKLGGNISIVTGNGDDYEADDYYSPYKRTIVNTAVSCDCYNTIQQCDNNVIFKYRNDMYLLDTTDLSNTDIVVLQSINDHVKQRLNNVEFPLNRIQTLPKGMTLAERKYDFHELYQYLEPEEIFSDVVDGVYSIIFPHQAFWYDTLETPEETLKYYEGDKEAYINKRIENVDIKPGLRWKCYFREGQSYNNISKTIYPWLRDVSSLLDIKGTIYFEGQVALVRSNNDIIRFNNEDGESYTDENFLLRFKSKAYDMDTPAMCKFLDNACLYYNRDFNDTADITCWINNEASYEIYGPENEAFINTEQGNEDQVRYDERYRFDEALNLAEKDLPLTKYRTSPYVDGIDKPVEVLNEYEGVKDAWGDWINPVLNRPQFTSRTLTPRWRFPFLSASVTIELTVNQAFALSALNFSYTSSDMPDFTRERLYREIIR